MSERRAATIAGLALGVLYLFEAVIATGVFFALWPILGGIFAAGLAGWDRDAQLTAGVGARAGARTGLVGGAVLLILGTPLTYFLLQRLGEQPGMFGMTFGVGMLPSLLIIFSIYALFGVVTAAAAGAVTGYFRGSASSRDPD